MNGLATGRRVAPALTRYGSTAVAFHWAVAALVVFLGTLGHPVRRHPSGVPRVLDQHPWLRRACLSRPRHRQTCLAHIPQAARSAARHWRVRSPIFAHGAPSPLCADGPHPDFGFVAFVWHGRAFDYGLARLNFGVASNRAVFEPAEEVHQVLAYCLFGLAALHAAAALYHHFVRRDGVLVRMLPGGTG